MKRPTSKQCVTLADKLTLLKSYIDEHHLSIIKVDNIAYIRDNHGFLNYTELKNGPDWYYSLKIPPLQSAVCFAYGADFELVDIDRIINNIEMFYLYAQNQVSPSTLLKMFEDNK